LAQCHQPWTGARIHNQSMKVTIEVENARSLESLLLRDPDQAGINLLEFIREFFPFRLWKLRRSTTR
jgi:hypothetical protein